MSTIAEMTLKVEVPDPPPDELLLSEDGVNLESDWHRIEINLLIELVNQQFAGRDDFFAGGNMFIYFNEEQARDKDFRGPDFFLVWGASRTPPRPHWTIWKEGGRYPHAIIELLSPWTAHIDRTIRKDVYERTFRTPDYFCYDPDTRRLEGWHLGNGHYEPLVPNERGWLWCVQLQLWLGIWFGSHLGHEMTWLRFFTAEGKMVPTIAEVAKNAERKAASAEQKAVAADQRATSAENEAAHARQQLEEQRQRTEAAELELARLKAQFEQKKNDAP